MNAAKSGFRGASTTVRVGDVHGAVALSLERVGLNAAVSSPAPSSIAAATAAPAAEKGRVSFAARPWAFLSIDGGAKSEKPLVAVALEAGTHTLRIVNDALKVDLQCPFQVEPGRDRPLLTMRLEEAQAACPNLEPPPSR